MNIIELRTCPGTHYPQHIKVLLKARKHWCDTCASKRGLARNTHSNVKAQVKANNAAKRQTADVEATSIAGAMQVLKAMQYIEARL